MLNYSLALSQGRSRTQVAYLVGILLLMWLICSSSTQAQRKPKPTRDVVTNSVSAACADDEQLADVTGLFSDITLKWSDESPLFKAVQSRAEKSCSAAGKDKAYLFHVAHWVARGKNHTSPYSLTSSDWYAYRAGTDAATKAAVLRPVKLKANGDPSLYGLKRAVIVGIDVFDSAAGVTITYKSSATQSTRQNIQALGQLIAALLGITLSTPTKGEIKLCKVAMAVECQDGTERLPFIVNVAVSLLLFLGSPRATILRSKMARARRIRRTAAIHRRRLRQEWPIARRCQLGILAALDVHLRSMIKNGGMSELESQFLVCVSLSFRF
jgi:hypothetical protein